MLHATKRNLTNSVYNSSRNKIIIQMGIDQRTAGIHALIVYQLQSYA